MGTRLAFVDSAVSELVELLKGSGVLVRLIDSKRSLLNQISEAVTTCGCVAAIDLYSHGQPGGLHIAGDFVDIDYLESCTQLLGAVGARIEAGGGIFVYGCSVGRGAVGRQFVDRLAHVSGVPVCASDWPVGDSELVGLAKPISCCFD